MPGHAEPEHEQIAEPEGQPGQKTDFCDVDRVQSVVRIDAEPDGAAGEHGGADIVADAVAGKTGQRGDPVRHVPLADGPQREEIVEGQRAERADHAKCGEPDLHQRLLRQRNQDHADVDALQGAYQRGDRDADDKQARGDSEPFPADPFVKATLQRGQHSMHSSSRQGGSRLERRRRPHMRNP